MSPEQWESVRELFRAALDLPPERRRDFLKAACSEPDIRAEVESRLSAATNTAAPIDQPRPAQARNAIDVALASDPNLPLWIGRTLGQYEIVALLGIGGMGEVYRARDRRLKRDVALKVLPGAFASDPDRMARFQREAEVLASLNHPNIAQIYGIEDTALVMELVEGENLKGPLPMMTAAKYARQMAEALEYAHEKGVIHRDLKPANIKITPDGMVKILDFGLAKAAQNPAPGIAHDATTAITAPQSGVVMGTPAYMSPEQASGQPVDKRADIWSFGVVLWEMLTGARLFSGDSVMHVIADVLRAQIDFSRLPPETPSAMRELLARCLERDSKERLRDLGEARVLLQKLVTDTGSKASTTVPSPTKTVQSRRSGRIWIAAGAIAIVAVAAGIPLWLYTNRTPPVPGPEKWKQVTNFPDSVTNPALSPDGHMLAFMRGQGGSFLENGKQLYVKILPDSPAVQLTHDPAPKMFPAFSPDGSRVAYSVGGWDTWVVPVLARGEPRLMLSGAEGLQWIDSNRVIFSENARRGMGIETAREDGSSKRELYMPNPKGMAHFSAISPNGRNVLVAEMVGTGPWLPCRLLPFDGSSPGRQVGPAPAMCTGVAWSPDGKWMYFTASVGKGLHIWRQRLNRGQPEQITFGPGAQDGMAISPDGKFLYTSAGTLHNSLLLHDKDGDRPFTGEENPTVILAFSADGSRLYYLAINELRALEIATGNSERLITGVTGATFSPATNEAIYSLPDGSAWIRNVDRGSSPRRLSLQGASWVQLGASGYVYFTAGGKPGAETNFGIRGSFGQYVFPGEHFFRMRLDGTDRKMLFPEDMSAAKISPDERLVVGLTHGGVIARPLGGKNTRLVCQCVFDWSGDGKSVLLTFRALGGESGSTVVVPLKNGSMLPELPAGGFRSSAQAAAVPGAMVIRAEMTAVGPGMSSWAAIAVASQRNIFQIPLK